MLLLSNVFPGNPGPDTLSPDTLYTKSILDKNKDDERRCKAMLQAMLTIVMKSCKISRNVGATGNNLPVLTYMPIILSENRFTSAGRNMSPTSTSVVGRKSIPHVIALNENDDTDTVSRIQAVFMPNSQLRSSFILDIGTTYGFGLSHKGTAKAFSLDELDETFTSKPKRRLILL